METKVNVLSNIEHELEASFDYAEIKEDIEKAYERERKKIEIPGFRKGKAPIAMVKKMYGDAIEFKASEKIANDKFWLIVDEKKLKPISAPQLVDIDFQKDSKLTFKIKYEVKPEIEVKDYTGLEFEKPVFKVSDEEVDREVFNVKLSNSELKDDDKIDDKNYQIKIKLKRTNTDNPEEQEPKEFAVELYNEKVNEDLVNSAVGKKLGDVFSFKFTDHRDVEKDGKMEHVHEDYEYEAEILEIKKLVLPELTEELVKKVTRNRVSTEQEFVESVRKDIQSYYDNQSEGILVNSILNKVVENNDFEPPKGYVATLLDKLVDSEEQKAKREGVKRFDRANAAKYLQDRALWTAKWHFISEKIAEKEKIEVGEEDIKKLAEKDAAETGISVDKLMKYYQESNRADALKDEKLIEFLKENNKIKEIDPSKKNKKKKEAK